MDLNTILNSLFEQFDVDGRGALSYHQVKAAVIAIDIDIDYFDILYEFQFPEDSREAATHRVSREQFLEVLTDEMSDDPHQFVDKAFSLITDGSYCIKPDDLVHVSTKVLDEENQIKLPEAQQLIQQFGVNSGDDKIFLPIFREIIEFPI